MTSFKVRTENKKLDAFIVINPDPKAPVVDFVAVYEYLKGIGIVYGIDEQAIKDAIETSRWGVEFKVASGRAPVNGKDGAVEYLFETSPTFAPKIKSDGTVDYHDLNINQNVAKDQQLARLIGPKEGEVGMDVFGSPIAPTKGKLARIVKGINTSFMDENKTILKADAEGNVKLRPGGAVEVETSFKIENDIDYSTGNIDTHGDLAIRGRIKAGFRVRASGDIEIGGEAEDAVIEAGGNVIIKGGYMGEGKGGITAGGNVIVKFVHRQTIRAKGDIRVYEESIQANLYADGNILVRDGKGVIMGGTVHSGKCIEANIIGNDHYVKTEVVAGEKPSLMEKIDQLRKEVAELNGNLTEIENKICKMMEVKTQDGLSEAAERTFRKMDKLSADIQATRDSKTQVLDTAEAELRELKQKSFIKIYNKVYPGTMLKIAGHGKVIEDEGGPYTFRIIKNEIASV